MKDTLDRIWMATFTAFLVIVALVAVAGGVYTVIAGDGGSEPQQSGCVVDPDGCADTYGDRERWPW